jgi:hypothetical protein
MLGSADDFTSISDLLVKGTSVGAIATAIERKGVYTWDRFGRWISAKEENGDADEIETKTFILANLSDCYATLVRTGYMPGLLGSGWPETQQCKALRYFGWSSAKLPDFERLYEEFLNEHHGSVNVPQRCDLEPAPQASIYQLLKGLVVVNYGEDILEDLNRQRSVRLSEIRNDLQKKGFIFDDGTLRRYLKHLPD